MFFYVASDFRIHLKSKKFASLNNFSLSGKEVQLLYKESREAEYFMYLARTALFYKKRNMIA